MVRLQNESDKFITIICILIENDSLIKELIMIMKLYYRSWKRWR